MCSLAMRRTRGEDRTRPAVEPIARPSTASAVQLIASPADAIAELCGGGAGAAPRDAAADDGDDCVDLNGFAFVGADFGEHAVDVRGNLSVDLVGGNFEERLVFLDGVSDFFQPLGDGAFKDGFAHLRHDDFDAGPAIGGGAECGIGGLFGCGSVAVLERNDWAEHLLRGSGAIFGSSATTVLMPTVSPSGNLISVSTPATGEGISASTLSVEISKSGSSFSTESPIS